MVGSGGSAAWWPALLLPLLLPAPAAAQQRIQIGPPTVAFLPLFVPDVSPSIGTGLPALLAERGDVSHILMEFYAPWCPHCQHFAPEMERIGEAFNSPGGNAGVLVCRVNCVADSPICAAMGITGFPTMYWGAANEFLQAERSQHWETSGLISVNANPRTADGVTAWINERLTAAGRPPVALSEATAFDAALAQRMESTYSATAAAANGGAGGGSGGSSGSLGSPTALNLWDAELAMVMTVQLMLAQPASASQLRVVADFVELLSRNTAPLAQCQGSMQALADYVARIKPGESPLAGLFAAWPSPCGRPIAYYGSEQSDWAMCKGSYPTTRGYTCGLWQLFHMLTAHSDDAHAVADLGTIRTWIENFFNCEDCRHNFLAMSTGIATSVRTRDDAVLWLWQAHNSVNLRLAQEQLQSVTAGQENLYKYDPAAPKVAWPSAEDCPRCHRGCATDARLSAVAARDALVWQPTPDEWDIGAVLAFLNAYYDATPPPAACDGEMGGAAAGNADRCSSGLANALAQVNLACCPATGCIGVPTSCSHPCAGVFLPWWQTCGAGLVGGGAAPPGLLAFAALCDPSNAIAPAPAATSDGTDLWSQVLGACVRPGQLVNGQFINAFDYSQLTTRDQAGHRARPGSPAAAFDAYITFLAEMPVGAVDALPAPARKALLINAYNALAVKTIVDRFNFGSMASIRDIGDVFSPVWTSQAGMLEGQPVSLDDVEKGTGSSAGGLVGLLPSYHDPRIHSSVICASVSCPDLSTAAFTAANVEELLDARASAWLAHTTKGLALDRATGTIHASKIFDWYRSDFDAWVPPIGGGGGGVTGGFRGFLERYAPREMQSQLRALPAAAFEQHAVLYFDYDWNLNSAPAGAIGGGH